MLEINDLHVKLEAEDQEIIKGLSLTVPKGDVHAIMGPNGSGKSTLAYVLGGRDGYEVTGGDIVWNGDSILELDPEEPWYHFCHGLALLRGGDPTSAIDRLSLVEGTWQCRTLCVKAAHAIASFELGRPEEARTELDDKIQV